MTRAQMAVFLLKAEHGSTLCAAALRRCLRRRRLPVPVRRLDRAARAEAITGGCGGGSYCPGNPVTRGQMAAFLVKTFHM